MKSHTNHELGLQEVKYIPLPETTRQKVRRSYANGVKLDKIIDGKQYSVKLTFTGILISHENILEFKERATRSSFKIIT